MANKKTYTDADAEFIRLKWTVEGWSMARIGRSIGRSRSAVASYIKRYGLTGKFVRTSKPRVVKRKPRKVVRKKTTVAGGIQRSTMLHPEVTRAAPETAKMLEELTATCCRWPYGEGSETKYCGHPVRSGHSWCPMHCDIVYNTEEGDKA